MKQYLKRFFLTGFAFSWGGPAIMAIVLLCLKASNAVDTLSINEVVLGIFSTTIMAFVAAGISTIYHIESIPIAFSALIHATVLYLDYLFLYLINGWIQSNKIWIFSLIFVIGFIVIWFSIYIPIYLKVKKINKKINQ